MFVSQKKFDELLIKCNILEKELESKDVELSILKEENTKLQANLIELNSETSSVSFEISDDLERVTPKTRFNKNIVKKLIENNYLASNKKEDEFAIHLAVMLLCSEAIEQIIFTFEETLKDVDGVGDDNEQ